MSSKANSTGTFSTDKSLNIYIYSAMLISDAQKHLYHCVTQVINFLYKILLFALLSYRCFQCARTVKSDDHKNVRKGCYGTTRRTHPNYVQEHEKRGLILKMDQKCVLCLP